MADRRDEIEDEDDTNSDGVTLLDVPSQRTRLNNSIKEFMAMLALLLPLQL